jgi:hypothetical protein
MDNEIKAWLYDILNAIMEIVLGAKCFFEFDLIITKQ